MINMASVQSPVVFCSVMALQKGGPGAGKVRGGHYFVSQKKAVETGFGIFLLKPIEAITGFVVSLGKTL